MTAALQKQDISTQWAIQKCKNIFWTTHTKMSDISILTYLYLSHEITAIVSFFIGLWLLRIRTELLLAAVRLHTIIFDDDDANNV